MNNQTMHHRINSGRNQALQRTYSGKNMSTLAGRSPYRSYPTDKSKSPMVLRAFGLITTLLSTLLSQH